MTYYSDLLIVIGELRALENGLQPRRSPSELRDLCREMLEIDPDEFLVREFSEMLEALPSDVKAEALGPLLADQVREMFRRL